RVLLVLREAGIAKRPRPIRIVEATVTHSMLRRTYEGRKLGTRHGEPPYSKGIRNGYLVLRVFVGVPTFLVLRRTHCELARSDHHQFGAGVAIFESDLGLQAATLATHSRLIAIAACWFQSDCWLRGHRRRRS